MKKNSVLFFFLFFFYSAFAQVFAQVFDGKHKPPKPEILSQVREEFHYEVHYGPIKLGYVDILAIRDTLYKGTPALMYKIIMRSNPKLWIIGNKLEHFYSIFAPYKDKSYGLLFWSDDIDSDIYNELRIEPDYDTNRTHVEMRFKKNKFLKRDIPLVPYTLLGPDIYFFSRFFAGKDTLIKSPIYVDTAIQTIELKYESRQENRIYSAFPDSIKTFKMYGDAPFEGPFGFNGKFLAWFGTDSLRIPLEAHADVWIGFVKVTLIDYKRRK